VQVGHRGFRSVRNAQLPVDRGEVKLDGVDRDAETRTDLPVGKTESGHLEHLGLPARERVKELRSAAGRLVGHADMLEAHTFGTHRPLGQHFPALA
jgi:hypothetical protein